MSLDFKTSTQYVWNMALTVEMVAQEALDLPISGRVLLVEQLLESLAGKITPDMERAHLDEIRARRAAVLAGQSTLIDGTEAMHAVRNALRK